MHIYTIGTTWDFPSGSVINNLPVSVGDVSLISVSGRSPGGGNGNPLHYACLGNPKDRGAWKVTVHRIARVGHKLATKQQQQYTYITKKKSLLPETMFFRF